ncbi:MAG TPA: GNAT family N-acetyltransferase [Solirubrobacteraceae bacterium]
MAERIDLKRARREAKALLKAARAGHAAALARLGAAPAPPLDSQEAPALPPGDRSVVGRADAQGAPAVPPGDPWRGRAGDRSWPRLADAQRAVARELGEASWPRLVRRAEAEAVERGDRARRLVLEATDRRLDHAEALLALPHEPTLEVALVLGDAGAVRAALADDAGAANRRLGPRRWPPLRYVTHSAFLGGPRTEGLLACARALLAAGADPNAEGVLYGAAGIAHEPELTALLLAAGADPDDDESLYHATEADDHACVRLLLDGGATVPGTNALAHALDKEDPELVRLLLAHAPGPDEPWRARWPERERALRWAVWRGRSPEIVRMLAAAGSDVEWAGDGVPPYRLAVRTGRPDLADALAELGARPTLEPGDERLGAAMRGDLAAALAAPGGSSRERGGAAPAAGGPSREGGGDLTPAELGAALVEAAGERNLGAVRALIALGAPLDARGLLGGTALHHAAWMGAPEVVQFLLAHGADPHDVSPETHSTPLGWAAHGSHHAPPGGDHVAAAELLFAAGAKPDADMVHEANGDTAEWLEAHLDDPGVPIGRWGELSHAARAEWLRRLAAAPGAATRPVGDGFAVRTGSDSNTDNGVVCSRVDPNEIPAAIAFLEGAPGMWLTEPETDPPDLGRRLQRAGARTERTAVTMGARTADLNLDAPPADIRDADDHGPAHRAQAWRDGRPVGDVAWMPWGRVVSVERLEIQEEHRGQGLGRALLAHATRDAAEAVLAPTPDTIAYYERLGFALERCPRERCFYLDR